ARVVTARIDQLSFLAPVYVGHLVTAKASVNHVGRTSMEVGVRVEAEDMLTGDVVHVASAYLVFVATDEHGRPVSLPPLLAETDEERRRMRLPRRGARCGCSDPERPRLPLLALGRCTCETPFASWPRWLPLSSSPGAARRVRRRRRHRRPGRRASRGRRSISSPEAPARSTSCMARASPTS